MDFLVGKILERPIHSFTQDISSFLTRDNQRIAAIGTLALACLAACYFIYRCCFLQKRANVIGVKVADDKPSIVKSVRVESKREEIKATPTLDKSAVDVKETDHAHLLEQAIQDNQELLEDYRALEQKAEKIEKLLNLEIDTLKSDNLRLQDTCEDQSRKIDQLVGDLQKEKELSFEQEGELLRLQGMVDKIKALAKSEPITSSSSTKPLRYVFVVNDPTTEKQIFKNFVTQPGVPLSEFISIKEAKQRQASLKKELDEGTINLFSTCIVPARFEKSKVNGHMSAVDALFDYHKTMVILLWRTGTTLDDRTDIERLMPATVFAEASDGTNVSRVVSLIFETDPKSRLDLILTNPKQALNDLQAKAEKLHELQDI